MRRSRRFGADRVERPSRLRGSRFVAGMVATLFAAVGLQIAGTVPAFANAANPQPDTSGTATVNNDGTVTANIGGTWIWPGQNCAGRYGEGWAVDWWGISPSKTPSPSFSLTDASVVSPPGTTSTGTVSPVGAIQLKNGSGNYFHVGQYYAGETINSPSTCSDTTVNGKVTSSGSWSATATYPSLSDIPAHVCVNIYDEHGKEGQMSTNSSDFSPVKDGDNSIQTNAFDPTSGMGYCVHLQVITQTIQGEIYTCNNGTPTTALASGGSISVPDANLSSSNPLAPTKVSTGTYTMDASAPSGYQFVPCGQSGVSISTDKGSASQSVKVPSGGSGDGVFYVSKVPAQPGYIEICKSSANNVSGSFSFTVAGKTVTVPAGACSSAFQVPSGTQTVHENNTPGYWMTSASTYPAGRLVSVNASKANATVTVVPGDISTQTIVTFVNHHTKGALKICQVAGSGVATGTNFQFTNTAVSGTTSVPAGPAPGGNCVVVSSSINQLTSVTITQAVPAGDHVTSIQVSPSARQVGSADLSNGKVTVRIGSGVTEVTYTDTTP